MPNYNVHKRIGWIASVIVGAFLIWLLLKQNIIIYTISWKIWLLVPVIIWFYSNLPDLDHHMSRLRKYFLLTLFALVTISAILLSFSNKYLIMLMMVGMIGVTIMLVKHRGIMHTYPFVIVVALPMLFFHWVLFLFAVTCSTSHIFSDRFYSGFKLRLKRLLHLKGETNINIKV